jgi:hypothetical protein
LFLLHLTALKWRRIYKSRDGLGMMEESKQGNGKDLEGDDVTVKDYLDGQ